MRKLIIYRDEEVRGTKVRTTLRTIVPTLAWEGYSKGGTVIDARARELARALEPTFTGITIA